MTKQALCRGRGQIYIYEGYSSTSREPLHTQAQVQYSPWTPKRFQLWVYLWEVLWRYRFGPNFITWVYSLYKSPSARVYMNNALSSSITLHRGTHQGCPLYAGIFGLTLEPLACLIRSSDFIREPSGGRLGGMHFCVCRWHPLYLGDCTKSLREALWPLLGYLYLLGQIPIIPPISGYCPIIADNLLPLLTSLQAKYTTWSMLPLSTIGRVNLLKMIFLPKFVYFFRQTPTLLPQFFFHRLDSIVTSFIWVGSTPTLYLSTLHLPINRGGLALPNFQLYYWAAVLFTI